MRPIAECATIQIDITSACVLRCSNCTRFCGTREPFFMDFEDFQVAIDSLVGYSEQAHAVVGIMGGEPTLHPLFEKFCKYAASKIAREKLGLWSTFPPAFKRYRETICKTFGVVLLNDHSRDDILHAPVLMAAEDYFRKECPQCAGSGQIGNFIYPANGPKCPACGGKGTVTDDANLFLATEHCWIQTSWSASINPTGAWFCEVAAALADLYRGTKDAAPEELGWMVEPDWWKKTTKDFTAQREWACRKCGAALPIARTRTSQDETDDISPSSLERLKEIKSRKLARGDAKVHEEFVFDAKLVGNTYPSQTYKDALYRQGIAAKYNIVLTLNSRGYWEPHLKEDMPDGVVPPQEERPSLFKILQGE